MLMYIIALVLVALSLLGVLLQKTYAYLPVKELKRQVARGDDMARVLYRAVAFGGSLRALVWTWIVLTAAAGFVLLARVAPALFGFIAVLLLLWVVFAWLPSARLTAAGARLAVLCTPAVVWVLNYLQPVFEHLSRLLHPSMHTGLYEREDLIELLENQERQPDSRIPVEELEIAKRALSFSDRRVSDIVIPRKRVRTISPDDAVSPVLADELHETGHHRFPVYDKASKTVVGVLWLSKINQLTNVKKGGHVRDHMDEDVVYVHENDSLADVLDAFFKTKRQLFVVVNSFEEYVGIITLDDVVLQLLGAQVSGEFVQFDDKKAVSQRHQHVPEPEVAEPVKDSADEQPAELDDTSSEASTEEKVSETD